MCVCVCVWLAAIGKWRRSTVDKGYNNSNNDDGDAHDKCMIRARVAAAANLKEAKEGQEVCLFVCNRLCVSRTTGEFKVLVVLSNLIKSDKSHANQTTYTLFVMWIICWK